MNGRIVVVISASLLTLVAAGCIENKGPQTGGETHWLSTCVKNEDCEWPLKCHCGVCTFGCTDSTDCAEADGPASCFGIVDPACTGAELTESGGMCLPECTSDNFCEAIESHLSCVDGACMDPPTVDPRDFGPDAGGVDAGIDSSQDAANDATLDDGGDCETTADCDEVHQICAGSPLTCRDRVEGDSCETDAECPGELYCSNDVCQDGSTGDFCDATGDCDEVDDICAGSPPACRDRILGETCANHEECPGELYCPDDECQVIPEHCGNDSLDPAESDLDCGGPCLPCELGAACLSDEDCQPNAHCSNEHCAQDGFEYIPAGRFWMGSPSGDTCPEGYPGSCDAEPGRVDNDETLHEVVLTTSFLLGTYPVTQQAWFELTGNRGWARHYDDCHDCPAGNFNWWESVTFANASSASQGLPECYTLSGCVGTLGGGMTCTEVIVNAPDGNLYLCEGYRLAMGAEWEYAYRAGTTTAFYNGPITSGAWACSHDEHLDAIAWYCANSDESPKPVGLKEPNAWGLYDMSGNIWEAVWDRQVLHEPYPSSLVTNPTGPDTGEERVWRGGAFYEFSRACRAPTHGNDPPEASLGGLRLARSVNPSCRDAYADRVAYFPFDSCSGTSPEAMSSGLDATLVGDSNCGSSDALSTAIETAWSSGTALKLDGDGDYAEVPDDPRLEPEQFTLSVWIYSDDWTLCEGPETHDSEACTIVYKGAPYQGFALDHDLELSLWILGSGEETEIDGPRLTTSTWHHVVVTFDGSTGKIYVSGELAASGAVSHGVEYGDGDLLVGATANTNVDFYGYIDEVSLWDYAKTAEEVAELYDSYFCP